MVQELVFGLQIRNWSLEYHYVGFAERLRPACLSTCKPDVLFMNDLLFFHLKFVQQILPEKLWYSSCLLTIVVRDPGLCVLM